MTKRNSNGVDTEVVYFWFKELAGAADKSFNAATAAKAAGIPKHRATWYEIIKRENMRDRYVKERTEEHTAKHAEREALHQSVMDEVAMGFEDFLVQYGKLLKHAMKAIEDKGEQAGLLLLRSDFAFGVEQFDRLFRMYLRAIGKPEKITHSSMDFRTTVTFKTYTPEERQKILRRKEGSIPQPKNSKEAAKMMHKVKLMSDEEDEV